MISLLIKQYASMMVWDDNQLIYGHLLFYYILNISMNIHEYVNKILCIIYHAIKDSCLRFNLIPSLKVLT